MTVLLGRLWTEDEGQDIAEYAVMLAVILVLVVGTIRLVGSNATNCHTRRAVIRIVPISASNADFLSVMLGV
jgi:Flp pilus assembly pilin Flp